MHVAMILDRERLANEHVMLNRILVGLMDHGAKVSRIVPEALDSETADHGERRVALAARITVPMRVLPWMRRNRTAQVLARLSGTPDVFYAVGDGAWPIGLDLARAAERPLALDVWSAAQLRRLPRGHRGELVSAYIAPTNALGAALRARVEPGLVCLAPMGVSLPKTPRQALVEPERSVAIAVIGSGRDVPAYRELLGGLSRIVRDRPQVQIFLELHGPNEHEIWRHAQKLQLLENISTFAESSAHRSLLTCCDILILPERFGELRSILLETMALGLPIVAAEDPFLDMLEDNGSALLVPDPDADLWARHVERLLSDPESARKIGSVGRQTIATTHRSVEQVEKLRTIFERVATGGTYLFDAVEDG